MIQDLFIEKLNWFKQNENPETVLMIADDQLLIKIVIAWTNLAAIRNDKLTELSNALENKTWEWLWENTSYSLAELKTKAGVSFSEHVLETRINHLIANRVIYPDGTINSFVQRYLREKVLGLFVTRRNDKGRKIV